MAAFVDQSQFLPLADALVQALKQSLGEHLKVFAFVDDEDGLGIGVLPDIDVERRHNPGRHTLQLRLMWPEAEWIDFSRATDSQRTERARAFAQQFAERLPALEAWYEFHLSSSSQVLNEPVDIQFQVIGQGPIPNLDANTV